MQLKEVEIPSGDASYVRKWEEAYLDRGREIFENTGVAEVLLKVVEEMRSELPDIEVIGDVLHPVYTHGTMGGPGLGWEFKEGERGSRRPVNTVTTFARILTGELVVAIGAGWYAFGEGAQDPDLLREAVMRGIEKPLVVG